MTSPVFVALDTTDVARARQIAERVRHHVGGLKLGLEYFCANGPDGVRAFQHGRRATCRAHRARGRIDPGRRR